MVFGIGAQEMVLIGLLVLVVFGPGKLPEMARAFGKFTHKSRASMDELKSEFVLEENQNYSSKKIKKRVAALKSKRSEIPKLTGENDEAERERKERKAEDDRQQETLSR